MHTTKLIPLALLLLGAAGLAAEADVLDPSFPVRLDASLPVSIIDAQAVLADREEN